MNKYLIPILLPLLFANASQAAEMLCGRLVYQAGRYQLQNAGLTRDGGFQHLNESVSLSSNGEIQDPDRLLNAEDTQPVNACAFGTLEGNFFETTAIQKGLNPRPGVTVSNLSLVSAGFGMANSVGCAGETGSWLGGVFNDTSCASSKSFSSHEIGPVCLEYPSNLNLGTGAYSIQGILCNGGTLQVRSARPQFIH